MDLVLQKKFRMPDGSLLWQSWGLSSLKTIESAHSFSSQLLTPSLCDMDLSILVKVARMEPPLIASCDSNVVPEAYQTAGTVCGSQDTRSVTDLGTD